MGNGNGDVRSPATGNPAFRLEKVSVILNIDDQHFPLLTRTLVLEQNGYVVVSASNAEDGMRLFREQHIDLVIADHFLSDSFGTTIAAEMKRVKPNVPIIIYSGATELPPGLENADMFLSKLEPVEVLLQKIGELLQRGGPAHGSSAIDCKTP